MNSIVPHYPQNHDFMSELARYAETELLDHKGKRVIPVVPCINLWMDEKRKLSAREYWKNLKREMSEHGIELVSHLHQLKILSQDGKRRMGDCVDAIALQRILMYMRDTKPEGLRMALIEKSEKFLSFTQQNLHEGRDAYENEFYNRQLPMFTDRDDPFADLGYQR